MKKITAWLGWSVLAAALLSPQFARAQGIYHNQRLFIVPTPGPVKIDGDLSDWDLSGEILTYVVEASMAYQSAKTAMMYDDQALYISARIADPTPMLNRADPATNPDFGWDGDAFQFRLCLDPALGFPLKFGYDRNPNDNLVHMTLWYFTDGKKPVLHLKYGMDFHDAPEYHKGIVPAEKFQAVYVAWPDGKGFTLEYRIPWSTLRAPKPLKAGDLAASAIQIQWSDPTGFHSTSGGWAVDLMSHAGFTYQSTDSWGKSIFAEKGHLPKELTQEGVPPVRKLPLKLAFKLPKEQVASVTLINAKGDRVRNIVAAETRPGGQVTESWDGLDDAGRVLPPGDYTWKGVYHDPLKTKYILAVSNSGSPSYNSADGKGAWGGDWGNPVDLCFTGDKGAILWSGSEAGTGLIGVNLAGQKQWGYRIGGTYLATDGEWVFAYLNGDKQVRAYILADGRQVNFKRNELWAEHNAGKETLCTGLAWQDGKLYVANTNANEIAEYNAKQGTIVRRLAVTNPTWVTAAGSGTLLVVSDGTVQRLNLADGKLAVFAKDHLDNPQGVAIGTDGTVYVGNLGKLHNVSVFAKDGRYQRSIGKAGGRAMANPPPAGGNCSLSRAGKWDDDTMLSPRGLAVDAKNRLWVTENDFSPKRVSVWEPTTGKLLDQKFGPCYVSTAACMDPKDPTRVYCQNVEWKVDLDKGTWAPSAVMFEAKPDSPYFWPHMINNIVFTAKNGKQYMHAAGIYSGVILGHFLWVRRGDHFEACAGLVGPGAALTWRKPAKDAAEAAQYGMLLWEDRNGDGMIQQDETRPTKMRPGGMHSTVDADLNFYATGMYSELYWERLSPKQILPNGVPVYDDASFKEVVYAKDGSVYTSDLTVNPADGSLLFYAGSDIKQLNRTEIWPITYWTKDGQMVWRNRLGCRWYDMYEFPIPKAGELFGCTKNLGITDGITGYSCYFGQAQLLTTDGVPIGTVMKDGRSGETGFAQIQCEWFTGQLVKIKDGRWFLLAGDQDGRVIQITGLETLKRFNGKLTISPEDTKAAGIALADWSSQKARAQSLVLSRSPETPNWLDIRGVKVDVDANRNFTARAAYNSTNLIVRYEVTSPFELVNSTTELPLIFKGGNLLDIQISTATPADPKHDKPVAGDIRVLITRHAGPSTGSGQGKPVAVIYRPKVAGFQGQPTPFTSPTGREIFDQIEVWDDVALAYEKTATGFNATVQIPLAKIGLTPKPGTTLRMDVGYIFGNETGNTTATRAYWSNHSFSSKVTQDVPSEIRLEPAEWGVATVE